MESPAHKNRLLLRWGVLRKYFDTLLRLEVADEAWVPAHFLSNCPIVKEHNLLTRVHWQYPGPCSTASERYSCTLRWPSTRRRGRNTPALLGQSPQVFGEIKTKRLSVKIGATHRPWQTSAYSRLTIFGPTLVSLLGASPHPPGPNALLRIRLYLISGRYRSPSIQRSVLVQRDPRTPPLSTHQV